MIFTFAPEASFNTPNYARSYAVDVTNERMQKLMEYDNVYEFNKMEAKLRYSPYHIIKGEIVSELTFENGAWSWLTGCLLGTRITITGYKFAEAKEEWAILTGYLDSDLVSDSTNFTINETVVGDFDNVAAIIVGSEFIEISTINNGSVTACSRGQEGTTAVAHGQKDLVYGLDADAARSIVLTSREKVSDFYQNSISLTTIHDRGDVLFGYSGVIIDEMTFNFRTFDPIVIHTFFTGADSANDLTLADSTAVDDGAIAGIEDIKVFSEHVPQYLRQMYIQVQNSVKVGSHGFSSTPQGFLVSRGFGYGVITWRDDSLQNLQEYEDNTKRHFSISTSKNNYRMIFALNDVRVNTLSHYFDDELIIQDSAPFYCFCAPVILYQL